MPKIILPVLLILPLIFPAHLSARMVMTWVAPYALDESTIALNSDFGGVGMGDGLSHLALQLWNPTNSGGIEYAPLSNLGEKPSDATIASYVDWAHVGNIKAMLCIYNNSETAPGWNWTLAKNAFGNNRITFVSSILAEMDRLQALGILMDGVELDLESSSEVPAGDKDLFVAFVAELSLALKNRGKELTIASFAFIWGAPNKDWWAELWPLVDGITSMGYEAISSKCVNGQWYTYCNYADQKSFVPTGGDPEKLMLGMPTDRASWEKASLAENLAWAENNGVSVSFWDAQITNSTWRTASTWNTLARIRGDLQPISTRNETPALFDHSIHFTEGKLEIFTSLKTAHVFLFDLEGRQIFSQTLPSGKHQLGLAPLAAGSYFVQITTDGKLYAQQAITLLE